MSIKNSLAPKHVTRNLIGRKNISHAKRSHIRISLPMATLVTDTGLDEKQYKLEALREHSPPWPRQIITFILPTVKMLRLGGEKAWWFWIITCTTICYATAVMVFFAHLLILEYPDHHQNLISSSLYYPGPLHKISLQSVDNCLSNVVHRQTHKPMLPKT